MRVSWTIVTWSVLTLVPVAQDGARGDRAEKVDAAYLLENYASGPTATPDEVRAFVLDELLARVDRDDTWPTSVASLDLGDFANAWLHVPLEPVDVQRLRPENAADAFVGLTGGGRDVTRDDLERVGPEVWRVVAERAWSRQGALLAELGPGPYSAVSLNTFLKERTPKKPKLAPVRERLRAVARDGGTIDRGAFARFELCERFASSDLDADGALDPWELAVGLSGLEAGHAHAAFVAWADRKTWVVPLDAALRAPSPPTRGLFQWALLGSLPKWEAILNELDSSRSAFSVEEVAGELERVKRVEAEAKAKKDAEKVSRVFADRGYLLSPSDAKAFRAAGDAEPKPGEPGGEPPSLFVRVVRDYSKPGVGAQPAMVGWTRDRGDRTTTLDASVMLEHYADWGRVTAAVRARRSSKSTATPTTTVDIREYYLGYRRDWTLDGDVLREHGVRIGALREEDELTDVDRNALVVDWFPALGRTVDFGVLEFRRSGWWDRVGKCDSKLDASWVPSFGVELSDYDKPAGSTVKEVPSHVRGELDLGLRWDDRYEWQTELTARSDLDEVYGYLTSALSIALFDSKVAKLTLSAKRGRDTPSFTRERRLEIGFSVKL